MDLSSLAIDGFGNLQISTNFSDSVIDLGSGKHNHLKTYSVGENRLHDGIEMSLWTRGVV
jgi:hypothetical protein